MTSSVPDIFQEKTLQEIFDRQGYLLLEFLKKEEIEILDNLFHALHKELPMGRFMSDSYSSDQTLKREASKRITEIFIPHFEEYFKDFTPFGSSFLYKTPGRNSELAVHQDWTIVDETKALAINIWVPLCDTNASNGTLHVLPGSHLHILPLRAPTLPFFFSGNEDMLMPYLLPLEVKAGQAVVLNQRLIHYSSSNLSDRVRIAITSGIKTKGAPMVFYYKDPNSSPDEIEFFHQDDDFLISFSNFQEDIMNRPTLGVWGGRMQYQLPRPNREELQYLLNSMYASAGLKLPQKQADTVKGWKNRLRKFLRSDT